MNKIRKYPEKTSRKYVTCFFKRFIRASMLTLAISFIYVKFSLETKGFVKHQKDGTQLFYTLFFETASLLKCIMVQRDILDNVNSIEQDTHFDDRNKPNRNCNDKPLHL